ncbi:MAG: hypothetical protein M3680_20355, partial [Myxococcota bacterium]|nr:hypothetical protein [Myxococcota bacterium]
AVPIAPVAIAAVPSELPPLTVVPDAAGSATAAIATAEEMPDTSPAPISVHDAITRPARLPPEMPVGIETPAPIAPPAPVATAGSLPAVSSFRPADPDDAVPTVRTKSVTAAPPMDELDGGWDLGDEDPTAGPDVPEAQSTPSSQEMAGDGVVDGDGLDQVD